MDAPGDEDWDKDTDEIKSVDSDELRANRPNRWTGAPSSWRTLTEQDRLTYTALEGVRNQDLSVHLYNAHALKRRLSFGEQDGRTPLNSRKKQTGHTEESEWKPPKLWTAWPMRAAAVPDDDILKRTGDEDDANEEYTFRSSAQEPPSSRLADAITSSVLKSAKEKFQRRGLGAPSDSDSSSPRSINGDTDSESENSSELPIKAESSQEAASGDGSDSRMALDEPRDNSNRVRTKRKPKPSRTFRPVPAANDDLSYDLLRPVTRHILANLDDTLTILHNARVAGLSAMSESSAGSASEDDAAPTKPAPTNPVRRGRGRPRSTAPFLKKEKSKFGRPRSVHAPRDGETEREMLVRIARQQKKRTPVFSDEELGAEADSEGTRDSSAPSARQDSTKPVSQKQHSPSSRQRAKHLARWGLRDWSDVVGAATLAGFSPRVIARTAQRCADLFGEGVDIHTLAEVGAKSGEPRRTTRYKPGYPCLDMSSPSDDEGHEDIEMRQRRSVSRQRGAALHTDHSSDEEGTYRPQRRGTSQGSAKLLSFCSVPNCPRSITGFMRRDNLVRHLRLVHGQGPEESGVGEDGENEMEGGVHVDGFLKPIEPGRGWRAGDTGKRYRSRKPRRRGESSGGSEDSEQGGARVDQESSEG